MIIYLLNFNFQPDINVEPTPGHQVRNKVFYENCFNIFFSLLKQLRKHTAAELLFSTKYQH